MPLSVQTSNIFYVYVSVYVHTGGCASVSQCECGGEKTTQELVLSVDHKDPGDGM